MKTGRFLFFLLRSAAVAFLTMLLSCCNVIVLIADWRFVFVLCRVYQFANTEKHKHKHKHKHTEKHPATPDVPVQAHHQATVECFGSFCMEILEAAIFKPALLRPGPKSLGIWLVTLNLSKMNYLSDGLARLDNIPTLTGKFLKAPLSLNLVPLHRETLSLAGAALPIRPAVVITGKDYRDQHVIISRGSIAVAKLIVSNMLPPINRIMWSTFVSGANICNWPSQKTSSINIATKKQQIFKNIARTKLIESSMLPPINRTMWAQRGRQQKLFGHVVKKRNWEV